MCPLLRGDPVHPNVHSIKRGSNFFKVIELLTQLKKDKSGDTLAYEDSAHKVILRTFSYFLKTVMHIGQEWFIFRNYLFQRLERLL